MPPAQQQDRRRSNSSQGSSPQPAPISQATDVSHVLRTTTTTDALTSRLDELARELRSRHEHITTQAQAFTAQAQLQTQILQDQARLARSLRQTGQERVQSIIGGETEASPSGELYRAIERYHDRRSSSTRDVALPSAQSLERMSSSSSRDLERRFSRDPVRSDAEGPPILPSFRPVSPLLDSLPPLRSYGSRRGASPYYTLSGTQSARIRASERYVERHRAAEARSSTSSLQDVIETAPDSDTPWSNAHYSAQLSTPSGFPSLAGLEARRSKRRRLESEKLGSKLKAIRYGKFGQVVPGRLKMEIESCDGGQFSHNSSYAAENILKDDGSVYCTKGNRCNIVLRHQGGSVFSLKELVIRAPGSNYSSPVREGMVFIAMQSDELLARTARYQIEYTKERAPRSHESSPQRIAPVSIRYNADGTVRGPIPAMAPSSRHLEDWSSDGNEDTYRTAAIPAEFCMSPPPFAIETLRDASSTEDDITNDSASYLSRRSGASRHVPPNHIGSLPFEIDSMDSYEYFDARWADLPNMLLADSESPGWRRPSAVPSSHGSLGGSGTVAAVAAVDATLAAAEEASRFATQEAVRAVGGGLMVPHAWFRFEQDQKKSTIRFDPPVTGRFVLIKMWNPHHDASKNIDIQGIVARGFAGPRLFPSVELR